MEQLFSDLEKTTHISTHGDYMHMITENGDKIIKASDFVKEMSDGELIKEGADGKFRFVMDSPDKGMRNAIFRGKCLGDSLTEEQAASISDGTFKDMFVGDYWTIGGVNWRIAHFDYWLRCGDAECKKHHIVVVPDTCLYNAQMHNTDSGQYEAGAANTTEGGYIGSDMYKTNLAQAKSIITNAFGAAHILSHRELLVNAVTNGRPSNHAWYDSTVELMNEPMVYGSYIFTPACDGTTISYRYTIDKSQLALFALRPDLICNRVSWWLRDVVSGAYFANVGSYGDAICRSASDPFGVRPAFGIC